MAKVKADEVLCPKCAEPIKAAASKCKHCGHEFSAAEMEQRAKAQAEAQKAGTIGCGVLALFAVLFLAFCTGGGDGSSTTSSADSAEDRSKGFHCLSGWDGSHRGFVDAVKRQLRDPESFEHDETRVTPVVDGQHTILMTFRSRNGFGGMNVGTAIGTYSNATCQATVVGIE